MSMPLPPPPDDYDAEADAVGCWALVIEITREMVRRGEPVPAVFLSKKERDGEGNGR